ncbi:MAG: MbnP family protein [Verrucomicrobiota bacterium]
MQHAFSGNFRNLWYGPRSLPWILWFCLLLLPGFASARSLQIVVHPMFGETPISLHQERTAISGEQFQVSRFDYLLSEVRIRETSGIWRSLGPPFSSGFAFGSAAQGPLRWSFPNLPPGDFDAIAFRVGVPTDVDGSDPAQYPPDHPLNPTVNGLHWGWREGYVHLALEGRYRKSDQSLGGFSYHLAGGAGPMPVELNVNFNTHRDATVELEFDVRAILGDHRIENQDSTHSRDGDSTAPVLAARVSQAFRLQKVSREMFQEVAAESQASPGSASAFPWRIPKRFPQVKLPEDNLPTRQGVALGRRLFFDPILSHQQQQSCASCHDPARAFTENRGVSIGVVGKEGKRNAMPLTNLLWEQAFFWDGRTARLRDQVLLPIEDPLEMNASLPEVLQDLNADSTYREAFAKAFGEPDITANRLALALEQYLLTELSYNSRFDQALRQEVELTEQEKRGFELFVTEHDPARGLRGADCFHCHGGALFTSHKFTNNGLEADFLDLGRFLATGEDSDRGKFKTPSLRNVAVTGPYMHDGRFSTLEEVIEHYDSGVQRTATLDPNLAKHPPAGLELSPADKSALIAFLQTLTDTRFLTSDEPVTKAPAFTQR